MIEVDRGTFSIEPFVQGGGRLITWADAQVEQTLADGWIPVPSSVWRAGELTLWTTAFAARHDGLAILFVRYRLESAPRSMPVRQLPCPLAEQVKEGCKAELDSYCKQVTPGEGRLLACL